MQNVNFREFPGVQWLGLHTSTAGGTGSIPGHGTKIPHAAQHGPPTPQKSQFYRDFPCGPVVENLPANAGDTGSRPGLGRSHMPRSN